ncbi:MAG: c-type cytochrome biogenesis protein CcsB [Burkholderiaceae bacterium]|nr:MAG: c-type cytochrome biogenesis protein CcsB [Burkholderiaceae bacterium]
MESTAEFSPPLPLFKRLSLADWLYAALLLLGAGIVLHRYGSGMDVYEKGILIAAVPVFAWLGWNWPPLRRLLPVIGALALLAISLYAGQLPLAEQKFLLKYFLASQPAIMWMSVLFFLALFCYWGGLLANAPTASWVGTAMTWTAVTMGFTGMLVRWYESYLIGADVGHIPVSNLYEVFVLFSLITAVFYLYYEQRYATRALGAFALLVICAAVGFLAWYTFDRGAQQIQPLLPALQSWWMKIHVPANFIGYGTFSLAAMVAFAWLIKQHGDTPIGWKIAPLFVLGTLLGAEPLVFRKSGLPEYWMAYFAVAAFIVGGILLLRQRIADRLPSLEVLDEVMYKSIAVGFAFFTIATILGALWAADAWGTYWQWDPKETWALIVWLNYAAWLHMRLMKGLRGSFAAYWALVGLLVTGFAFLGVNMFLSGLHSYGEL